MLREQLGTADLQEAAWVAANYPYRPGTFWIGRTLDGHAVGYDDDRHVCLISGTRGGKGVSIIVNNSCLWPGSLVICDPKGENATLTAARRGQGDEYCTGMGQDVHVLDPFSAAQVDDCYRSSFNPLAALDTENEKTIGEVSRIAASIVIVDDNSENKAWDEQARTLVRGVILHVLSWDRFDDSQRNLLTVAELIQTGDEVLAEAMRGAYPDKKPDPPHLLLLRDMQLNPAFGGRVARIGSQFRAMMEDAPKQFQGVLHSATSNLEFVDDPEMVRVLSGSGRTFHLSELKTNPRGVSLYLSLPLNKIRDKHYRWLRMMVDLLTTQMEITRVKPPRPKAAPTATGYRVLTILDEFPSLRRMEIIEQAAAQIAGFGMKLAFVVQTLAQMKETYKDGWETFFSNAGLKIAFSVDDNFSREHLSKHIGDTEITRELQSSNQSQSVNTSVSEGTSDSQSFSQSTTEGTSTSHTQGTSISHTRGGSLSLTRGTSDSINQSENAGVNSSTNAGQNAGVSRSLGWSAGVSSGVSGTIDNVRDSNGRGVAVPRETVSEGRNASLSGSGSSSKGLSRGDSRGVSVAHTEGGSFGLNRSVSLGINRSVSEGTSDSLTEGVSHSDTLGISQTLGRSRTQTQGSAKTTGSGRNETLHRRALFNPDEIGRAFSRIDDKRDPHYPGLALVVISGCNPFVVRRTNYFDDPQFIECFSPHPDHAFQPAFTHRIGGLAELIRPLEAAMNGGCRLTIGEWIVRRGEATVDKIAARIDHVAPDDRTVFIEVPCPGIVSQLADDNQLATGEYPIPDGPLFTIKSYSETAVSDPFWQLRQACLDLVKSKEHRPPAPVAPAVSIPAPKRVAALPAPAKATKTPEDFSFLKWGFAAMWFADYAGTFDLLRHHPFDIGPLFCVFLISVFFALAVLYIDDRIKAEPNCYHRFEFSLGEASRVSTFAAAALTVIVALGSYFMRAQVAGM